MSGRLTLSDPLVKELAQASCVHEKYYDDLPKLQGEGNWQEWSDALQHAALMAGTDAVLNGESKHPKSLEGKQSTTAEWNDNIKRTAIWRSRNESLLKAMRGAADVDFDDFGASNAYDTYISLGSRYHTSDDQRAFALFSEGLLGTCELDDSPEEIANDLQNAFNQYNQLVGDNIEQRLPENFLKMTFLDSLQFDYHDWRKALLKERDVLALGQGSALTFSELVELVVVEQTRLLHVQTKQPTPADTPAPVLPPQQASKRNITQVDEPSQSYLHRPCSVPHHSNSDHTNQVCMIQNPRLRPVDWKPSKDDEMWLAGHPEIEEPQPCDSSERSESRPENGPDNGPVTRLDGNSEDEFEGDSENDDESDVGSGLEGNDESTQASVGNQDDTLASGQDGISGQKDDDDKDLEHGTTADGAWEEFAAARSAEVQAQIDSVTQAGVRRKETGKTVLMHKPP
ncbi:hypothetical protein E4T50_16671 [Aureobasidium sp. EXF-12298]|nr:hypothetical protein E4T50_16671 [Aureobasidium sp. EXF-12298]